MANNMMSTFKSLYQEAHRLTLLGEFSQADHLCFRLLQYPTLPLAYRAGCNMLLSFGDDKPVEFAQEAVYWYREMFNEIRNDPGDGPKHQALLEQAEDALEDARRRAAEADEQEEDDSHIGSDEEMIDVVEQEEQGGEDDAPAGSQHIQQSQESEHQDLPSSTPGSTVIGSSQVVQAGEALAKDKGSDSDEPVQEI